MGRATSSPCKQSAPALANLSRLVIVTRVPNRAFCDRTLAEHTQQTSGREACARVDARARFLNVSGLGHSCHLRSPRHSASTDPVRRPSKLCEATVSNATTSAAQIEMMCADVQLPSPTACWRSMLPRSAGSRAAGTAFSSAGAASRRRPLRCLGHATRLAHGVPRRRTPQAPADLRGACASELQMPRARCRAAGRACIGRVTCTYRTALPCV